MNDNSPQSERGGRPRVLVVGGGFGGVSVATALAGAPVDVLLVDRANHHTFQPMLYQLATGIVSEGEIAAPLRGVFAGQDNAQTRLAEVGAIDLDRRQLSARAPDEQQITFDYDYLVVAAGAHPAYFGHEQWAQHAPGLKTLTDAHRVRTRILGALEMAADAADAAERRRWMTFVVVGGGPTGVEITGQIAELTHRLLQGEFTAIDTAAARIVIVDAGDSLLKMFPQRLRDVARRDLERMGVEVQLQRTVQDIDGGGATVADEQGATERIEAGTVLWAAGVHGSPLGDQLVHGSDAQAGHGGRVKVDEHCALPGRPEVFVIGDLADNGLPGVAQPAIQEGRHVAKVISARVRGATEPGPFRYFDKGSLATIGHGRAIANAFGVQVWGRPAQLMWGGVHLVYLVGWGNRFGTALRWMWTLATRRRRELSLASTQAIREGVISSGDRPAQAGDPSAHTAGD